MQTKKFEERLKLFPGSFHKVVPFDERDHFLNLDFTETNTELTDEILTNTALFSDYINTKLQNSRAKYGIGGYNEHRTIYSRSRVFDGHQGDDEPRRLHLGIDIWGELGTPVYSPLDAIVHSFAFNDAYGDYGATLILKHQLNGFTFYTLYGHLDLKSIQDKNEGQTIRKGEQIGLFGKPEENGQWPPHLHFQIIIDMDRGKGDYPGVCKFSESDNYLSNSPDPDLILGMMKYAVR